MNRLNYLKLALIIGLLIPLNDSWSSDLESINTNVLDITGIRRNEVITEAPKINHEPSTKEEAFLIDILDLKNMDIMDVLKLVSQKSGLNIVAAQNVKGRITVYLKDVKALEALRIIVEANGWVYAKDDNIIKVMTPAEYEQKYGYKYGEALETKILQLLFVKPTELAAVLTQIKGNNGKVIPDDKSHTLILMDSSAKIQEMEEIAKRIDVPIETRTFQLSYGLAEEVSGKVTELLTPTVGSMKFDVRSNTIIVSDTEQKLDDIAHIIESFDKKDKEVLIESKILQVTLDERHRLGVDWEKMLNNFHSLNLKSNFDILGENEKGGTVSFGTIENDQYTALVHALSTVGNTNTLSSPRITAVNNKEAKILVGSSEPYVTSTTTTNEGGTVTSETVNFIEVGVKLYVTPTIHRDGFITMKIKPEVSSAPRTLTTSNNNTIPIVETSEAETTVTVKDGVTIVIGGLIKDGTGKTVNKVPVFGDIPVVGAAFRNKNRTVNKNEIVIFLTPKIVTGDVTTEISGIDKEDDTNQIY